MSLKASESDENFNVPFFFFYCEKAIVKVVVVVTIQYLPSFQKCH